MKNNLTFNSDGSSILQVLVAAGIAAIIALGTATMINNQYKETKAIGEKLIVYNLEGQLKSLFQSSDYCNCAFKNRTFDVSVSPPVINPSSQFTNVLNGYTSAPPGCANSGTNLIPPIGGAISGTNMTISKLELEPLVNVSPGIYKADLSIEFGNTVRAIKGIKTNIQFSIDLLGGGGDTDRPFSTCGIGLISTCPVGMVMIEGGPGRSSFCIDVNERSDAAGHRAMAVNKCASFGLTLCSAAKWRAACNSGLLGAISKNWSNDFGGWDNCPNQYGCAVVVGPACNTTSWEVINTSGLNYYRCCTQ